jgi:peptidoglycan L-alanyl-D-glutamate endopeptidase CwlK
MFDTREKKLPSAESSTWGKSPAKGAHESANVGPSVLPGIAGQLGNGALASAGQGSTASSADMSALFGRSFGDGLSAGTKAVAEATSAKILPDSDKVAKDLKARLANNPKATRSLDSLTSDKSFQGLSEDQRSGLLKQFQTAPNSATTRYLKGLAEYEKEKSEDKSGDPEKEKERLAKLEDARNPDGGSFSLNGQNYTIKNGKLLDAKGNESGTIDNLGNYQMSGEKASSNYYNNLSARVKLQEGSGKDEKTLLDLHAADPNGLLDGASMNNTFVGKAKDTLRAVRHEGMDMGVAPQGAFRSFQEQDDLYAKGRSKPGDIVTGAEAGESWHNYGLATDLAFYNDKGQIHWPENGDYAKQWTRYGELAKEQNLRWGGDWTKRPDRPHIEYHPGFDDDEAGKLKSEHTSGGLEAVWDKMKIGHILDPSPEPKK